MANNATFKDAAGVTQTAKTTDSGGVHTGHQNIDSLPPLPAGNNNIGVVTVASLPGDVLEIPATPTISTTVYASGEVVGTKMVFANAARVAAGSGDVLSVALDDKDAEQTPMELWLFNADPVNTTITDNAAWALSDLDLSKRIAVIPLGPYYSSNANAGSDTPNPGYSYKLPSGTSIWGVLVARGTPTYGTTSDLVVRLLVGRH